MIFKLIKKFKDTRPKYMEYYDDDKPTKAMLREAKELGINVTEGMSLFDLQRETHIALDKAAKAYNDKLDEMSDLIEDTKYSLTGDMARISNSSGIMAERGE